MNKQERALAGKTILLVDQDMTNALALQDRIVSQGGRVLTAYSAERAMLLATNAALSDAVINLTFRGSDKIVQILKARHVSYLFLAGQLQPRVEADERSARTPVWPWAKQTTTVDAQALLAIVEQ